TFINLAGINHTVPQRETILSERLHTHTQAFSGFSYYISGEARLQAGRYMQPCHARPQVKRFGELRPQAAHELLPPLGVNAAHFSDVASKVSLVNESG